MLYGEAKVSTTKRVNCAETSTSNAEPAKLPMLLLRSMETALNTDSPNYTYTFEETVRQKMIENAFPVLA